MEWTPKTIKDRRDAKGLTQQDLADAIGVSRSIITKWETGERNASGPGIRGLQRILGAGLDDDDLSVRDATEVELLTELLRRRLAAERDPVAGRPPLPDVPLIIPGPESDTDDGEGDTGGRRSRRR